MEKNAFRRNTPETFKLSLYEEGIWVNRKWQEDSDDKLSILFHVSISESKFREEVYNYILLEQSIH